MSIQTNNVAFSAASGVKTLVTLPCAMRGALGHLYLKQTSGSLEGFKYKIFDRKGASTVGVDLYCKGGVLTSIANNGSGKCRLTVTAADLVGVKVGDTIEVKGSDVSGYNVLTHVVTAMVSTTQFDTNQNYTAPGTGGMWQTAPQVYATSDPDIHMVVNEVTIAAATAFSSQDLADLSYENRDNQSVTARRRASALYLQIEPQGTGTKNFEISITTHARGVTA